MIRLQPIDSNETLLESIDVLYKQVWNDSIKERMIKHSKYEGFRGYVISSSVGEVLGFSYGYSSLSGQYYHDLLANALGPIEYEKWLEDCFEIVEVAVHPLYRNQGYGKLLVNELVKGINNQTAVLTTQKHNYAARHLYKELGWGLIKDPFIPGNADNPYVIMGKVLR